MTQAEKNELLDKLSVCYNRVNYLKLLCDEANKPDEAAQFDRRKARLKVEIDGLLRDLYENWIGNANSLKTSLQNSNNGVEASIKEIEGDIKVAENIVKAIGYIDDVIKVAAALFA